MGATDDRVAELLDRWLASVELHLRYRDLDDDAYARVRDWPPHQRPTRWILELARTRCLELKRLLAERAQRRDEGFAESLELMAFLANLLGSEHLERYIPLAVEDAAKAKPTAAPAAAARPPEARTAAAAPAAGRARSTARPDPPPVSASKAARKPPPGARPAAAIPRQPRVVDPDPATATVVADAVRLLKWGREWPQLAGLIARLADRPAEPEIWTILRRHRAEIEAQATRPTV